MQVQPIKINVSQFEFTKKILKNLSNFNLSPTSKLVLLTLSTYYNPNKPAYPKQETISKELGISLASVKRAIKELSELGLILVECKYSNHYLFTSKIFEILKLTLSTAQNETKQQINLTPHDKTINKNNSKSITYNYKNNRRDAWRSQEGVKYESAYSTIQKYKKDKETAVSPLDFDREQSIEYINKLPEFAKSGFFAVELRKKWKL